MADVVVVGGGVLGTCTALHLAEAGARDVVLLERSNRLGSQTTSAGAGFVGYWAGELEAELAAYAMDYYERLQDEVGENLGVRRSGLLFPAVSEAGVEMLKQEYEREKEFVPAIRFLDADETAAACGLLERSSVFGAIYQRQAQQVPTNRMMTALERLLHCAGVDVRLGVAANRVESVGERVVGVETSAGFLRAGAVVNAAGAFAHQLGKQSGVSVGAVPLLESRFVTDPLAGVTSDMPMMLFFERDLLYVREEQDGLLVGAIEQHLRDASCPSLENPPDVSALPAHANDEHEALARRCDDIIPTLARMTVRDRASGLPTWTPDGRHVLGCAPGLDGYVVLAGCNECGVTHGPGLARIASELALTGRTDADIAPYRVGRFGHLSEHEIVNGAIAQYLSRHPPKPGQAATPFGITLPAADND